MLSEQQLEEQLIKHLQGAGYELVRIKDDVELKQNLKIQLEKHNQKQLNKHGLSSLSAAEFGRVLHILEKGDIYQKAKTLRELQEIDLDNGEKWSFEFINKQQWCQNIFQVSHQISNEGKYKNRYDVTLLINGLPLVQIELKKIGLELKEAFNQINRYQQHSFGANGGLFQYLQIFIISNGANTKYYSNNRQLNFKQTFYWTDRHNNRISQLLPSLELGARENSPNNFAEAFLERCHLSKMICKYMVIGLSEGNRTIRILRPYQFYAVEAVVERAKTTNNNGYIWHTTGSGKTLTSFKCSQLIAEIPEVKKVLFVVDRKDLDYQTIREFNAFSAGSVSSVENTAMLVKQLTDDTKIIVTTIQKLNNAIERDRYAQQLQALAEQKIVFIFDECHRSQFGQTNRRIRNFFKRGQLFGFTGTPIWDKNANQDGHTTQYIFGEELHQYVISDAISDGNVLPFSVEYIGATQPANSQASPIKGKKSKKNSLEIATKEIDNELIMEHPDRLEKIADYILEQHGRKTQHGRFNAMFCVDSINSLIKYYDIFKTKSPIAQGKLTIATIFSYVANENLEDGQNGIFEELAISEEPKVLYGLKPHNREKLDEYISHYNQQFGTEFSTRDSQSFYDYYNDISKRVRNKQIDILLVVNMFLTGFDSPMLNTLYVDKNLKFHGLIQAYSRTNRTVDETKSHGQIMVFRDLKDPTDEAVELFSNKKNENKPIHFKSYEEHVEEFAQALQKLTAICPSPSDCDQLKSEAEKLEFAKAFRELMRKQHVLESFTDFEWEDLKIEEQVFETFKSKYLDLHESISKQKEESPSPLQEIDFELELLHKVEINVDYILSLLAKGQNAKAKDKEAINHKVQELLNTNVQLRSKRELINSFMEQRLPLIPEGEQVKEQFEEFVGEQRGKAFDALTATLQLDPARASALIREYIYSQRRPADEVIANTKTERIKILERRTLIPSIWEKITEFIKTYF